MRTRAVTMTLCLSEKSNSLLVDLGYGGDLQAAKEEYERHGDFSSD